MEKLVLADDLAAQVEAHLRPGDRPLWCGRPARAPVSLRTHALALAMGLVFASFMPFVVLAQAGINAEAYASASFFMASFGIALAGYAALYVAGLQLLRARTIYAITRSSAVVICDLPGWRTRMVSLGPANRTHLSAERHDRGTIRFAPLSPIAGLPPAFYHVRHARQVYELAAALDRGADKEELAALGVVAPELLGP